MEFPSEVRNKINGLCETENVKLLSESAARLSDNYRVENAGGKRSASSRADILTYCAVRMSATFAAVSRALELALECFDGKIESVLDVGAGTGAGAIAAHMLTDCADITMIEREKNMADIGRQLTECVGIRGNWKMRDISDGISEKADLVICSYCLNELPEVKRGKAVSELMKAASGLLVIVEPGTPASFASVSQMRKILLNGGFEIAAPCPHGGDCPMSDEDWCHFSARAARSKLHKRLKNADVPYEDEKFCFLAAVRSGQTAAPKASPCEFRILRRPFIQPSRITLNLCGKDGTFTQVITKSSPKFKTARKSDAGDAFT